MNHIKFMVCPHDTANNPDKWYQLAQYLSKLLSAGIQFHISLDFPEYHQNLTQGGLIYANPQDSLRLIKEYDYTPVARSSNLFDEIVFIASLAVNNPCLQDMQADQIISVNSMMVTRVGIKHLIDREILPVRILPRTTWMAVVKAIYREEFKFGMVYKDFYEGLNSLTKRGFITLDQTRGGTIFHSLLVSSKYKEMAEDIQLCLVAMENQNERAQKVLQELSIERFIPVSRKDILQFESLSILGEELMIYD